jgi:radical SAM protein with 4Fe4S-binding SPASM domain
LIDLSEAKYDPNGLLLMKFYPEIINLELTNACNLACRFCNHAEMTQHMARGEMSAEILAKVLAEASQHPVFEIGLVGLGEPLLCRQLAHHFNAIAAYQQSFSRISLNSNALALTEKMSHLILGSPVNFITFSLNAGTATSYRELMCFDGFDRVVKNLRSFLEFRHQGKRSIEVRIQVMESCQAELETARKLFYDFLDDSVQLFCRQEYTKPATIVAPHPTIPERRHPCWSIYSRVYIDIAGNLYPCTIGNDCYREKSQLCLGNVREKTMTDLFNGPEIVAARLLAEKALSAFPECRECNVWQLLPNNFTWGGSRWQRKPNPELRQPHLKN